MNTILQWLLLAVAVGIGWALGRWRLRAESEEPIIDDEETLRDRLQFLFTNYSDEAIESFLETLAVSRETVSLHLSIGAHFREKGEVARATLIHQNLLARPELSGHDSSQVTYELALDYLAAGLLDRAEALLQELLGVAHYGVLAAEQLVLIYQRERDWIKAAEVAGTLVSVRDSPKVRKQLAHLLCEQALENDGSSPTTDSRKLLEQALEYDRDCVRASLLLADWYRYHRRWRETQQYLSGVFEQNPVFGPEAVTRLVRYAREAGTERKLRRRLYGLYQRYPSTTLLLNLVEQEKRFNSAARARQLLETEMTHRPSLRGLLRLIEMNDPEPRGEDPQSRLVSRVGDMLLEDKPTYQCNRCGFGGQQLHWMCPSCKHWETVEPVYGVDGE